MRIVTEKGIVWTSQGVTLPNGTQFRMRYRGQDHFGFMHRGRFYIDGEYASSPSGAAKRVAGENLNGWKYWHVRRPEDDVWRPLWRLRPSSGRSPAK